MENKKYICIFCGKIIKNNYSALVAHEKMCEYNPLNKELYVPYEYQGICEKCGKEFVKLFKTKKLFIRDYQNRKKLPRFCSLSCSNSHKVTEETKEKIRNGLILFNEKNPNFNKLIYYKKIKNKNDYDKLSEDRINEILPTLQTILICKNCLKEFLYDKNKSFSRLYCSQECKHKYLSEHTGGYRKGSGRGKSGWYKGIYCDSTWELAFVIYHLDNNLKIERCKEHRKYIFNGEEHTYTPDFITDEGIIEIKGYKNDAWIEKEKQNPDIKVLYREDMKFYLDYVVRVYGSDFVNLYDGVNINKKGLNSKTITWFYKVNHYNKTYINIYLLI